MEAIGNAGSAIGILAKDGVVLVGEKKVTSKLLQTSTSSEKMYKIDDHVACVVAATAIGANNQAAQSMLKQDYKDDITREDAVQLALKVLSKTMDNTSLTSEKLELAEVYLTPYGKVNYLVHTLKSLNTLLEKSGLTQPASETS
ncbi:unnamed protein product [Amaranthus hypochondriacus]